ncbi:hypothetical protein NC652_036384 [Populus alba x Populus x berolinensis]|nr:hypothetical protein NC652_036384 [Populus alba x Populus x berolinensis]
MKLPKNFQDESYSIDDVLIPIRNANSNVYFYKNENKKKRIYFLKIWTNRSLAPKIALHEVS